MGQGLMETLTLIHGLAQRALIEISQATVGGLSVASSNVRPSWRTSTNRPRQNGRNKGGAARYQLPDPHLFTPYPMFVNGGEVQFLAHLVPFPNYPPPSAYYI